jgi:hypothetical protein
MAHAHRLVQAAELSLVESFVESIDLTYRADPHYGEICDGRVEHSLAAFTRLSRSLLDRAFDARFKPHQSPKARFNGLLIEALAKPLKRLIPSTLKRAKISVLD